MRNTKLIAATLFASLIVPAASRADAFDPKQVPTDAKWLVHVDMDAARDTKSFELVRDDILSSADAQAKIDQIEKITGAKFPEDLHDVTIYGKDSGDEAGVIMVHARIDQQQMGNMLRMSDQYASTPHGNHEVLTWLDKDKNQTMFGSFYDESNFIIGRTEANIEAALDTLDGKAASIKANSPLTGGAKPQLLIYVAAKDISQLHQAGAKPNPVVGSIESAWISLSEKDETITLHGDLTGTSEDTARNLKTSLDGLKGMLSLAAGGEDADPVAKAVVAASKTFATTQQDKSVVVDWPVTVEQISSIVKAIADKQVAPKN